jgi:hypothetical protein
VTADSRLNQLAELRRRREQRALDLVIMQNEKCRHAESNADATADALSRQTAGARVRERSLLDPLVGHAVPRIAITRVQTEIAKLSLETARLRAAAASAQASLLDQRKAHAVAQEHFRLRQRAAAKLALVLQQDMARRSSRQTALSEIEDEDRSAAMAERQE